MNKKEEQELEELYADLKEEARLNDKRRKKYDRIVIEQMMKVCSKEEVLKILGELENKKIIETSGFTIKKIGLFNYPDDTTAGDKGHIGFIAKKV